MNQRSAELPVVVGIGHEQPGLLEYAYAWADRWQVPLRVVHCYSFHDVAVDIYSTADSSGAQTRALALLDRAREHVQELGSIELELSLDDGFASTTLERESKHAAAVVVGAGDAGWLRRLVAADVAQYEAMHAHAPVFVVPDQAGVAELQNLVLAIDEENIAEGPVEFAFDTAARTGARLRILCVVPRIAFAAEPSRYGTHLAEITEAWSARYPRVDVTPSLLCGDVEDETLIAASSAQLIILGRPNEPRRGKIFGVPVAETVMREAACPVVIVPANFHPGAGWPHRVGTFAPDLG